MKTAEEVRRIMKADKKVLKICKLIEKEIIESAKHNHTGTSVFLDTEICHDELVEPVVDELRRNGYVANADVFADRDGECVQFNLNWGTKK